MLNYSVIAFLRIVLLFWRIKGRETELDVSVVSTHSHTSSPNHVQALPAEDILKAWLFS